MIGWLRLVLMIFYAPLRGMREARDRGALLPIALIALLSQIAYSFVSAKLSASPSDVKRSPLLGEHTDDILRSVVGFDDEEIAAAREEGAI